MMTLLRRQLPLTFCLLLVGASAGRAQRHTSSIGNAGPLQSQALSFSYTGQPFNVSQCNALPIFLGGWSTTCGSGQIKAAIQVPIPAALTGAVLLSFTGGDWLVPGGKPLYTCAVLSQDRSQSGYFDCSQTAQSVTNTATGRTISISSSACELEISLTFSSGVITAWGLFGDCSTTEGFIDIFTFSSPILGTPTEEPNPFYEEAYDKCDESTRSCVLGFTTSPGKWSAGADSPPATDGTQAEKGLGVCPCHGVGEPATGDPIDVGTGNLFEQVVDYTTSGPNQLSFTRYYNSLASSSTLAGVLGKNWRSTFDRYLRIQSPTSIVAERGDGQALTFTLGGGAWSSDADVDMKLVQTGTGWTLSTQNDEVETYALASGSMTQALLGSIQQRNGYKQILQYGMDNKLASVTDSYNRSLTFTYQGNLIQTVTTPDGLVLTYGYSSSGATPGVLDQLTSVSYSTTPSTSQSYLYENPALPFALTGLIDENGSRFTTWTYDANGRGTSSQHAGGADLTTITYNDADGSRIVTNALGLQNVYKFTTLQGIPKLMEIDRAASTGIPAATRKFTYDSNGYVASRTDWNGNLTTYVNDVHGQPTSITEASGTPQARTTTITYHPSFQLPTTIVTPGLTTTLTYDAVGNLLTRTLTDTTTATVPYSTNGQSRTWTYTWANSLPTSVQGPRTDVNALTKFAYDGSGALISTTNALGQITKVNQHTPGGLPQTVVDPNGVTSQMTYDARQRLLTSTLNTSAGGLTRTNTYEAAGNLTSVTLPDGSSLTNAYDATHRLTGLSDLFNQTNTYTLDAMGDRTQTAVFDVNGVMQRQHSANFDPLGRLSQDIGGAGQTVSYTLDANGNATAITDGLGNLTGQSFDALNRRTTIADAGKGVTRISYDAHDRPLSVTDANGGATSYTYNGFGDVIQLVSPDTGTTVYHYDPAGNLTQKINAAGSTANYAYDALNRILTTKYPANTAENVAYTYDQTGHGFGIGRLTSVSDAVGTLTLSWDERGNLLSEKRTRGTATLNTAYSWDLADRLGSVTYPSGWVAVYPRDAMGRVTNITAQAPGSTSPVPLISNVTYQPFGPVNALSYGNGIAETLNFDSDYRLISLNDAGANPVQNLNYSYDAGNNVTAILDGITSANSQTFAYDALNRLINANGVYGAFAYTYDLNGNRLSQALGSATTTYSYAPKTNRLISITASGSAQTVGTTAAGNASSFSPAFGSVTTLTYNQSNRLATTSSGNNQLTSYSYDAFGHRLLKVGATTGTTLYQYDASGHLLEEADGLASAQVDYIYLGDLPVATIQPAGGQIYFLHDDRLGTPQMATDSNQAVAWTARYQPFGQISAPAVLIAQDLRLPGQESDLETGLYHNGFRDYAPGLGRYVQSDPIGLAGGINTYAYVGSNPANVDRTGLVPNDGQASFESALLANPVLQFIGDNPQIGWYLMGGGATLLTGGLAAELLAPSEVAVACPLSQTISNSTLTNSTAELLNYSNTGGFAQANADFAAIVGDSPVTTYPGGVSSAPYGQGTISVRPYSSSGAATIQIDTPGAAQIKIRY